MGGTPFKFLLAFLLIATQFGCDGSASEPYDRQNNPNLLFEDQLKHQATEAGNPGSSTTKLVQVIVDDSDGSETEASSTETNYVYSDQFIRCDEILIHSSSSTSLHANPTRDAGNLGSVSQHNSSHQPEGGKQLAIEVTRSDGEVFIFAVEDNDEEISFLEIQRAIGAGETAFDSKCRNDSTVSENYIYQIDALLEFSSQLSGSRFTDDEN